MKRHLLGFCLTLSLCGFGFAQQSASQLNLSQQIVVPRLVRFTGQVKDATGTVGITFTLHKGQQDNAALWIETQNVKLDSEGKYSVLLGATKAEGIPTELFTSGEAQWLGVQVEGKKQQPRVLLVSVPYALKAAEAETLAGHAATEFVTTDKLNTAVQQQLKQQGGSTSPGGTKSGVKPSVPTDPATNFVDNTTNQVLGVTQNGTGMGIFATATTGVAVRGNSTGTAIYGVSTGSGSAAALQGTSSSLTGKGIYGFATAATGINYGVLGSTVSPSGIGMYGYNNATTGVPVGILGSAFSTSGIAIKATENSATGATTGFLSSVASPSGTAAVFQNSGGGRLISGQSGASNTQVFSVGGNGSVSSSGSIAAASSVSGNWGSFQTSTSNFVGLFAYNNSNIASTPAAKIVNLDTTGAGDWVLDAEGPGFGGQCTIDVSGNLFCTGVLAPVVAKPNGTKTAMYTMQTTENFVEDFGSARLVNGVAKINIDSALAGVVSGENNYHVFLTPGGECHGLYITNRTATSFEVHELHGGKSNVEFDFRVVAHRAGFEHQRMPDVTQRLAPAPASSMSAQRASLEGAGKQ